MLTDRYEVDAMDVHFHGIDDILMRESNNAVKSAARSIIELNNQTTEILRNLGGFFCTTRDLNGNMKKKQTREINDRCG